MRLLRVRMKCFFLKVKKTTREEEGHLWSEVGWRVSKKQQLGRWDEIWGKKKLPQL